MPKLINIASKRGSTIGRVQRENAEECGWETRVRWMNTE